MIKTIVIHALSCAVLPGGIVFYLCGQLMKHYPPAWPNIWYGYRTPASVRTKETFDTANSFSAALLIKYGTLMIIGGLLIGMMFMEKYASYFEFGGVLVSLLTVVLLIVKTEREIARLFDKKGKPKQ